MELTWYTKSFSDLTNIEVYELLRLRQQIFVVEQNCSYLDADSKDFIAHHLLGYYDEKLVAYCRLLPPGTTFPEISIGRIVIHPDARGTGTGVRLVRLAVEECKKLFGEGTIKIGAQKWLKNFYMKTGFEDIGQPFYEDGIAHLTMVRK